MKYQRLLRSGSVLALAMPLLGLLVGGCRSIERESSETPATPAQVSDGNPVPIEIEDDHVLVRAALNGHEVRFVLDTGASHVLVSPEVAAAAGIAMTTKVRLAGFGNGRAFGRKGIADSITVGPAAAARVPVVITPIPQPFMADGLLGLSFLRHFAFGLDYQHGLASFALTTSNNPPADGPGISLEAEAPPLVVPAEVDGVPAKLVVDTGAGPSLILRSWFVEKHRLRERYPKRLSIVTGAGLLGQIRGDIARVQTVKLGDYTLTNVFAEFETGAATRSDDIAGFVGAAFLRRFRLTFDIPGRRLWLEPNASYSTESTPPASVRSGFVCLPKGTNWIVTDLIAGAPAAEAGVRDGDHLLEINGVPVQSLKPGQIKRVFQAEPGTAVRLRLQTRRDPPRDATLILRDLL